MGRGAGEPPEAAWAHLGPYGYVLQYMSRAARQACLERIIAAWNAAKLASLPALLLRMDIRAGAAEDEADVAMAELTVYATANSVDLRQVPSQTEL